MSTPVHGAPIAVLQKNAREQVRITLYTYKDADSVDVRAFNDINGLGIYLSTKDGLRLPVELLPELISALKRAEAEVHRGLLGGKVVAP